MEADATMDRACETVATRAIDSELPKQCKRDQRDKSGNLAYDAAGEGGEKKRNVDRHQQRDRDEEPKQQLTRSADIFEAIARDLGIAPEKTPNVGREPEAIDAERHQQKHSA